jgi:hypothetical protein
MRRGRLQATSLVFAAWLSLFSVSAGAVDIPAIDGHMTDRTHTLSRADRKSIDDKLTRLQKDVLVDVAAWIVDAPEDALDEMGNEAYAKWKIGNGSDNGLFFVIPKSGQVHVIQNPNNPELSPHEVSRVLQADRPESSIADRINAVIDAASRILRIKCLRPRPPGTTDPARGVWYGAGTAAVLLAAIALTVRDRLRKP